MLKDRNSSAIIAVSDLARARTFYEGALGLTLDGGDVEGGFLNFLTGETSLGVYASEFAGTNKANAVTWEMKGDIVEVVNDLRSKGVTFEHYPDLGTLNGDVHKSGDMKMVWFKDPDGNILHLVQGM